MIRSHYSNTAYGQMRDRLAEKEKQLKKQETEQKKNRVPYRTLMQF